MLTPSNTYYETSRGQEMFGCLSFSANIGLGNLCDFLYWTAGGLSNIF